MGRTQFRRDTVIVANSELYAWAFRKTCTPAIVLVAHGPTYPTLRSRRPIAAMTFRKLVEPAAINLVRVLVAIDDETATYFKRNYPQAIVRKIPLAIDLTMFAPINHELAKKRLGLSGRAVLLFVGRLAAEKDPELAIDVYDALQECRPNTTLIVAGGGPLESRVRRNVASRRRSADIRLIGAVRREELPLLYSAADALLVTSEVEQSPSVVWEALSCGTPVIATASGELPLVLSEPTLGRTVPHSREALVSILLRHFPENDLERAKYELLRRHEAARRSWDQIGPEFVKVLHETLASV
ncbi:MAG TPA: glycosyltransferase [Thermoplasmata archaeon]